MKRSWIVIAALLLLQIDSAAQTRNFGWKVTGRDGAIYLVGSVHLLTKDFYPLHDALEAAYKDSELLVEEVDIADMTGPGSQMAMLQKGMQPSSTPIEKVLAPATLALLQKKAADLGLPIDALKQFKPWMIALTIESMQWMKNGFDPQFGLDMHFYEQAKKDNKMVQGLETVEYQIARFDEMSPELQEHLLSETLKEIDTEQAGMTKLLDAWRTGNAAAAETIVLKDLKQEPQLYQRLLIERNRNWMPKIEALFTKKTRSLVVVGAAHLVGPDGLLAMLKAKGYKVEQL
jgi:uncharacterized protein